MRDVKYCCECGIKISDANTSDWYSHLSIKYCETCRIKVKKQQTAARLKAYRKREKQRKKEQLEYIKLLEAENANFRKMFLVTERSDLDEYNAEDSGGLQPT